MSINKEELTRAFQDFYDHLLKDPYLSTFFPSFKKVKGLVEKQVETLDYIQKLLEEGKQEEVHKIGLEIAQRHFALKIHEQFLFKMIGFLKNRLLAEREINRRSVLLMLEEVRKTTGIVYAKNLIQDFLDTVKLESKQQRIIFNSLKDLKDFIEGTKSQEAVVKDHTQCELGEYTESLEFLIKTYKLPEERIKFEVEHKEYHQLQNYVVSFLSRGEYEKALILLRNLFLSGLHLASMLKEFDLNWELNSEDIFFSFLSDEFHNDVVLHIIVENIKDKELRSQIVSKLYTELLNEFKNDKEVFTFKHEDKIYVCMGVREATELDRFTRKFGEVIERISKKLSELYVAIIERPIFLIALVDFSSIKDIKPDMVKELFQVMDEKLYELSEGNKEVIFLHNFRTEIEELVSEAKEKVKFRKFVCDAVSSGKVELFAQDIVDLESKDTLGIELLARLKYKNKYITASQFINIIELENLTLEFDSIVMKKLITLADKVSKKSKNVFINVYPSSLQSERFYSLIKEAINELSKRSVNLVIEITEHSLLLNKNLLKELDKHRFFVAFDDFGIGYTNFERVATLASVDRAKYLKLDGSLVKEMLSSKIHYSIVKSVSTFAKESGLELVYEFVENEKIRNTLRELAKEIGIKAYGQGWYFGKPKALS